jgi:tubulin polyglutamylase TTLL5
VGPRRFKLDPRIDDSETAFLREHLGAEGWEPTAGDDWHLNWSAAVQPLRVFRGLGDGQRVNHFPGIAPMHYKDELAHFLGPDCGFHPATFSMPHQRDALLSAMADRPQAVWIRKPKRSQAGLGIELLTSPGQVPDEDEWIVQRYVADPLLLPDRPFKHVLRVFVLVTSLDPLVAYVHRNGVVKFTSRPFRTDAHALTDPVVHLTNPRVQRQNTDVPDPVRAMDFDGYRDVLAAAAIDPLPVFGAISEMLAATLSALRDPVLGLSAKWAERLDCCFELLGFDVMLDAAHRPWLLECNISPALGVRGRTGSPDQGAQRRGKGPMVADMLSVVGTDADAFHDGAQPHPAGGFELLDYGGGGLVGSFGSNGSP